jgi:hypothetical protein
MFEINIYVNAIPRDEINLNTINAIGDSICFVLVD